jgi:hypothetical protein
MCTTATHTQAMCAQQAIFGLFLGFAVLPAAPAEVLSSTALNLWCYMRHVTLFALLRRASALGAVQI